MSEAVASTRSAGSAAVQGELWGWRAADWSAIQEPRQAAMYEDALSRAAIGSGTRVLDLACGAGVFCAMAAARGAAVSGIDAAAPLIELARQRVPAADLRVGDMQFLPFADGAFDALCSFTSIQFAADRGAALADAHRVAAPGARLLLYVWGPNERCEMSPLMQAWGPLMPPPPPAPAGAPKPVPLWTPGVLAALVTGAGWQQPQEGALVTSWEYDDEEQLLRAMLASAGGALVVPHAGEERARAVASEVLRPYRQADGRYRMRNEWRWLLATA